MGGYFAPWKLEQWGGRSIYEFLGVRFFKRYLLPDVTLLRLRGGTGMRGGRAERETELERLEWETKRNEVIHLLALLLTVCILVSRPRELSASQFLAIFGINLYVNIFPIFVQRHNRLRIRRIGRRGAGRGMSRRPGRTSI